MTEISPERSGASLAAWYRPKRFADVVGQRHVTAVLARSLAHDRLPSQLLFSGGSGLGKTTLARVTAAALLCETPMSKRAGDACGYCESCLDVTTPGRMHPDVIEFDAASNGGKDEIRSIAERARLMPMRGKKKVYIIDEAHGLSGPGGQAFLKLLEEPPAHVVFMLATTDPDKMLATNRGRCTEYELSSPTPDEMVTNLLRVASAEGWPLSEPAALAIVHASDPALGVRATLMSLEKLSSLLDDGEALTADDVALQLQSASRPLLDELTTAISAGDPSLAFAALAALRTTSNDAALFDALTIWARLQLLSSTASTFERARYRLAQLVERPRTTGNLEIAVANMASPSDAAALAQLVEQAKELLPLLTKALEAAPTTTSQLAVAPSPSTPEASPLIDTPTPVASSEVAHTENSSVIYDIDEFIEAIGTSLPRAAALLRSCQLTAEPGVIKVLPPASLRQSILDLRGDLSPLAATLGVRLSLLSPAKE